MDIVNHRDSLGRTADRLDGGRLCVGFLGGSITDGRGGSNWPEGVGSWLVESFPKARIVLENAAIGATGSESGLFRCERDIIERGCDLVFVEYAVNDSQVPTERRMKSREGLLRKLVAAGRDVVLTYAFGRTMYDDLLAGRQPDTVAEFEQLAERYRIGSVWMGLHALLQLQAGRIRWEQWLPDGVHPSPWGSAIYAEAVCEFLRAELLSSRASGPMRGGEDLPEPVDPGHWQGAYRLGPEAVRTHGPWLLRRWLGNPWMDLVLDTGAVGATAGFEFEGTGALIGLDFGQTSADFRVRVDDGAWRVIELDRPEWCGDEGWYRFVPVAQDLPRGRHTMELEVVHGGQPGCRGTSFRLADVGVVP